MAPHRTESVVGESVSVTGRITGDGDLEVRGRVDGEVDVRGDLTIADGAVLRAALAGARVTIRGAVLGDVTGTDAIFLDASARVVGNLRAPRISIALGAQVRGDLDMGEVIAGERPAARPAQRPAAQPAARPAARAPLPPARPVAMPRQNPAPIAIAAPPPAPSAAPRTPPEPVVPAIKKGAKAAKKKA
ncbi:MAG: polymer-forming cytoskeletal protein [Deltaproteobacteria bacterium]|nr:polymer-forming cytoskeletal protein [Deltaproteobacteria bacterium]